MADKKKKRSWKKKLGNALKAGAVLAGGLALAKNRNRNAMIKGADANEGFGAMTLKDYGPHKIGGYHTPRTDSVLASPRWDSWNANYMPLKKGGRVGCGKAKRGFGRALKGGK